MGNFFCSAVPAMRGAIPPAAHCAVCGAEFAPKTRAQKYCGAKCRKQAERERAFPAQRFLCAQCGKEFAACGRRHKYCSDICGAKALRAAAAARYAAAGAPPKAQKTEKLCAVCGGAFLSRRRNARLCGAASCAREDNRRKAAAVYAKKRGLLPRPPAAAHCAVCGAGFAPKTRAQKYCGAKCRKQAERAQTKEYVAGLRAAADAATGRPAAKACAVCGAEFAPYTRRQRYCGAECRKQAERLNISNRRPPARKTCAVCGVKLYSRFPGLKYCSRECAKQAEAAQAYAYLTGSGAVYAPLPPARKTCALCGAAMKASRRGAKYCGAECRKQAAAQRNSAALPAPAKRSCVFCGAEFAPKTRAQRFCGARCYDAMRAEARRQAKSAALPPPRRA